MAYVLIVALLVIVIALGWMVGNQSKTIEKYEQELINKAKEGRKINVSK